MEQCDVLIVAHDRQKREVVYQALVSCGYTCALASNGEEGLVVFRETRPLLVITDLILPVLQENPDVAVIALTNPLNMGEFLVAVERILGRRAPPVGRTARLRDQVERWTTPEQFLDAFEYRSRQSPSVKSEGRWIIGTATHSMSS